MDSLKHNTLKILLLVLLVICGSNLNIQVARAATVNINPGDNIQSIVIANPAGTTFLIAPGIHRMQTITPRNGDIFQGQTGSILSGAKILSGWAQSGSTWNVGGQTQQGSVVGSIAAGECKSDSPRCGYPEDLFMDNVIKKHVDSLGAVAPGTWFFDYDNDKIYVGDNPAGKTVETSVTPEAFHIAQYGGVSNVTIKNLIIEKHAAPTQKAAVSLGTYLDNGWLITDCEVRWNHGDGINTGPNSIARNNFVHHNGNFGFTGSGPNILVENNEISYNNTVGYNSFWGAGGSKWVYTDGLVVRGNKSHHNRGPGLWTDINNINTLYENNILEDNERAGIFHEISYSAVIKNNTLRRNGTGHDFPGWAAGAGIEVTSSSNVEVYGNTLEENWQGITGLDDHRGTGNHGPYELKNLNVHNNTVNYLTSQGAGSGRTGVVDTEGVNGPALSALANNHFENNTYKLPATGMYFVWGEDRTDSGWIGLGNDETGSITRGTSTPTPLVGDFNLDHIVNTLDWSLMNAKWFTNDATMDLNKDTMVNTIDFSTMNVNWLKTW